MLNLRKILLAIYHKGVSILLAAGLERLRFFKVANKLIMFVLRSNYVEAQGHKMFLDAKDSLHLSISGFHELLATELMNKEIKEGDVIIDVGANIGYYALIFARLVGGNGKVFAFEPDPTSFALLKKNVKLNGYKNIVLIQKAVSDKNGKLKLYLAEDNLGDHRPYDSRDGRQYVEVEAVRLDDYFKDYERKINFVKMDIQGGEVKALQGMMNLLKKNQEVKVFTEFWPEGLEIAGIKPKDCLDLLLELGFKLYNINERGHKVEPISPPEVLAAYPNAKEDFTNLLCLR